jgi:ribosomal subunit interface protein
MRSLAMERPTHSIRGEISMDVTVHGRHHHVPSPSLKELATEKVLRLSRYLPAITAIDVEMYGEGNHQHNNGYVVEITVLAGGPTFRAKAAAGDLGSCIDMATHQLSRQLREFNQKRSGRPAHVAKGRSPPRENVAAIGDAPGPDARRATEEDLVWAARASDAARQRMIATKAH